NTERSKEFVNQMQSYVPDAHIEIRETAEETVKNSDVFVTATVAKNPIVKEDWVEKGALFLQVGGNETEFNVIHKADKIVVDDWEKIKSRGNKTIGHMYNEGKFNEENIYASLGELVNKLKKGR